MYIYVVTVSTCHTIKTVLEICCASGLKLRPMCLFNTASHSYVLSLALGHEESYIIDYLCNIILKQQKKSTES